jgi:SSS family solute:Na+ symporter/sodium/pantothenate symporter
VLAGIIMAAPFAAIMSTVDSTILVISSSLVRDVYQRSVNPDASQARIRTLSYLTTFIVGAVVMLGALNPPRFLQTIIVLTGAGCACTYLAPMFFALYWRRMNSTGVFAGMVGGFGLFITLYVLGWIGWLDRPDGMTPHPGGVLPLVWGLGGSIVGCVAGSLLTRPPPRDLVEKFFD